MLRFSRKLAVCGSVAIGSVRHSSLYLPAISYAEAVLSQHKTALDILSSEPSLYSKQSAQFEATIGQHVRHNLDHYNKLMQVAGQPSHSDKHGKKKTQSKEYVAPDTSAIIDYDTRERGTPEETQIVTAARLVSRLQEQVQQLEPVLLKPVNVRFVASAQGESFLIRSSVERELAFVAHHAIHHLVFVKLIAREFGVKLPEHVGIAPSTLAARHA